MKIVDNQNRDNLGEGRSYGIGFAFLKKLSKDEYETVQPISPCKDYLNDVVFSESTGKQITAYGLKYKKQEIFEGKYGYLCFSILDHLGGGEYIKKKEEIELCNHNYEAMASLLNYFEKEYFGLKEKTTITKVDENLFFCKIPMFWCKATYRISLWSLLCRCSMWYDGSTTPEEYLKTVRGPDQYTLNDAQKKIEKLKITQPAPEQDMNNLTPGTYVHNLGIVSYAL